MLIKIPLLSFLLFGMTYPLFFWLTAKDPIKHNFHRFHLACPVIMAGLAIIGLYYLPVPVILRHAGLVWLACAFLTTAIFWNKDGVNPWVITLLCLWGLKFFAAVYGHLMQFNYLELAICILSGLIVSGIFYAMNLGHFYLNVHGLPIKHLIQATKAFTLLLILRLLWNIYYVPSAKVMAGGQEMALLPWMNSIEGFMLWVAIFFGTVFPLGGLYFVFGTLKLKNTQATTGILYVLLSAVLLGDLAYKYYLIKYSIPM